MQIEEGKFYVRRDGEIAGPAFRIHNANSQMVWAVGKYTYTDDGHYWAFRCANEWDLVSEYTISNIPTPQSAPGYSVIFDGAKVGREPVPVVAKGERVLWEGVDANCITVVRLCAYDEWLHSLNGKRIRIIEVPE